MVMKTPDFWYRKPTQPANPAEYLLTPASLLYALGHKLNQSRTPTAKAGVPVLCIGNIVAGGGGKTPTALALHRLIKEHKIANSPFFLTRGYGGQLAGPLLLDPTRHTANDIGDEALLLGTKGPVIIAADRPAGAALAQKSGADIILMDDGFQNPSLHKDISLLVIDGDTGLGNGKRIPAGPLRETLKHALSRTHGVIIIGEDRHNIHDQIPENIPVFRAGIIPCFTGDKSISYIGFAGLARPEKFRRTIERSGLKLSAFHAFADHHPYSEAEINGLIAESNKKNAKLITTEKDIRRIPEKFRKHIKTLPIALAWQDEKAIIEFLKKRIH